MLSRIVRHEARLLIADRSLAAAALILGAVVAYGVFNGASWAAFQRATLEAAGREESARLGELRARLGSPGDGQGVPADQVGSTLGARHAGMPPGPLSPLVIGQGDLYPYYFLVTTASRQSFLADDEIENPTHLLSGRFDLGFVIVALYPLVILAMSYNLLSAEKEQGTLVLVLSQPVPLRTLVLGKVLARGLAVVGLAVGISIAGFLLAGGSAANGGLLRVGLWLAVVAAYGTFWFALAVAVNALGRSSSANALALAGTWLLLVAVVPALANVLVRATYPVPSRVELTQAIRNASNRAQSEGPRLSARFLEAHPELVRERAEYHEFAVQSLAVQEAVEASVAAVLDRFEMQLGRQQALVDRLRFLSPAIAALEALQDVAGTGSARYRHFVDQVEVFHDRWRSHFRPRILRGEPIRADDLGRLPEFAFREEPLGAVALRVAIGLAGLVAPSLVVCALGRAAMRRFPIVGE